MDDYLFKKLEELEYRIVQLENQNRGLVWEEVEEMPKPEILMQHILINMKYQTYKVCINGVYYVYVIPENSKFLVDLQTGDLIPKEDDKLFEMME